MPGLVILGTDTGVGKTWVTGQLARHLETKKPGQVVTQKWVQTGALTPEDIHAHWAAMGVEPSRFAPYMKAICPYCFSFPSSPHLAAEKEGYIIDPSRFLTAYSALAKQFSWVLVEGSGGLFTPITRSQTLLDSVEKIQLPVVLVAANKLGAINHTLLSVESLKARRIPIRAILLNDGIRVDSDKAEILADNPLVIASLTDVPTFCSKDATFCWECIIAMS